MAPSNTRSLESIRAYRIDLSLPPSERYVEVAKDFAPRMKAITPLFDEVLASIIPWPSLRRFIEFLASIFLRRVCSKEETQELKGIAKASGLDMYFLVALNVLLDSLLGCTSGGVVVREEKKRKMDSRDCVRAEERMMQFRTLDWGMDELRSVLVVLEFVRSKSADPERVIGRTITYAGFVGVLTGVRENLSLSLNFRPNHNCSTVALRLHQILVLFGFRPSIASLIRSSFIPEKSTPPPLLSTAAALVESRSAPCYLILCDGSRTAIIEKDLFDGKVRTGTDFIVQTNHDTPPTEPSDHTHSQKEVSSIIGMEALLEDSKERCACIQKKWDSMKRRYEKRQQSGKIEPDDDDSSGPIVREETLQGWIKAYPIMNECSHFGCIMDPKTGTIRWLERGEQ